MKNIKVIAVYIVMLCSAMCLSIGTFYADQWLLLVGLCFAILSTLLASILDLI